MSTTLLNAKNPLALFNRVFQAHEVAFLTQRQREMRTELAARERTIIEQLDRQRQRAQYARDIREGLLHFVGEKQLLQNRTPLLTGDAAVCHV